MKKLIFLVLLASACSNSSKETTDAPVSPPPPPPPAPCFTGTPQTHDQIINACVDQSVTRIVKYADLTTLRAALPLLNADGSLPPLP